MICISIVIFDTNYGWFAFEYSETLPSQVSQIKINVLTDQNDNQHLKLIYMDDNVRPSSYNTV